jgi:hypothetical protein
MMEQVASESITSHGESADWRRRHLRLFGRGVCKKTELADGQQVLAFLFFIRLKLIWYCFSGFRGPDPAS